jgi:hypothetical protein
VYFGGNDIQEWQINHPEICFNIHNKDFLNIQGLVVSLSWQSKTKE